MQQNAIVAENPVDTDAMFDTSPAAMAERFGARVRQQLRDGGHSVRQLARLAASFAFLADTSLRLIDRDAWTVEVAGQRFLTMRGAAEVKSGLRSTVVH